LSILQPKTFTEAIMYEGIVLVLLLVPTLIYSLWGKGRSKPRISLRSAKLLDIIVILLTLITAISSVLPIGNEAVRPIIFFIMEGVLSGLFVVYTVFRGKFSVLLFAMVVAVLTPTISLFVWNHMYPPSTLSILPLYTSGNVTAYQTGFASAEAEGLYYFIPIYDLLMVPFGLITNLTTSGINIIYPTVQLVVSFLMFWVLLRKIGADKSLPGLMLLISIPNLSVVIGRIGLPLPYMFLVLLLLMMNTVQPSRKTISLMILPIIVGVFAHPIAPITLIGLFVVSSLIPLLKFTSIKGMDKALKITLLITSAYWFNLYLSTLVLGDAKSLYDAGIGFVSMLLGGKAGEVIGGTTITSLIAPGYSDPSFRIFSYAWAVPFAIAASLALALIFFFLRKKPTESVLSGAKINLGFSSAISSILFIAFAFSGYVIGSGSAQYMLPVAFFLAMLSSVIAIDLTLEKFKIFPVIIIVILLASMVALGSYSPEYATTEHPNFEVSSTIHPYDTYIQSNDLLGLLKQNITVYSDYDITISLGLYKPVRQIIYSILDGQSTFRDYGQALFILTIARLQQEAVLNQSSISDIVYMSDTHLVISVQG